MTMEHEGGCETEEPRIDELSTTGSRAAYERFLPEAEALSGPFATPRANLGIAYHNVREGVAAVLSEASRLREDVPKYDFDRMRTLPDLVLAVIYAVGLVDRRAPKSTRTLIAEAAQLRGKLLLAAETLATAGLVPSNEVIRIRKGKGFIDIADDCIALGRLFNDHADAIRGKSAVTALEVREASELGTRLRTILRPKGTRKAPPEPALAQALENRDRLWTLLVERYELVRRAGVWLFGLEKGSELVPALGSRVRAKPKTKGSTAS